MNTESKPEMVSVPRDIAEKAHTAMCRDSCCSFAECDEMRQWLAATPAPAATQPTPDEDFAQSVFDAAPQEVAEMTTPHTDSTAPASDTDIQKSTVSAKDGYAASDGGELAKSLIECVETWPKSSRKFYWHQIELMRQAAAMLSGK